MENDGRCRYKKRFYCMKATPERSKTGIGFQMRATAIIAVGLSLSASHPIDLVRSRMQTMPQLLRSGQLAIPYLSLRDCVRRMHLEEGCTSFWKGNLATLLRFCPSETLNWSFKQGFKSILPLSEAPLNFAAGAFAAILTRLLLYPLDMARLLLSSSKTKDSITESLQGRIKDSGIRGIYRGAVASLFGVALFRSTFFGLYDSLKGSTNGEGQKLLLSYCSTICALFITYPGDTVRRRIMLANPYHSFMNFALKICRSEGIKGLYRGASVIYLQGVTTSFLYFTIDCFLTNFFKNPY